MKSRPICSVIPPYILHRIIANGTDEQRHCAQQTLMHVQSLMVSHNPRPEPHEKLPAGQANRNIHDAEQQQQLPGKQVRAEGQPSNSDIAVDEAYNYLGVTYDFFWKIFQRNSLDAEGLPLTGTVHYGQDYQNAFWNGQQMVFGDGDGKIFNRFTIALDVVAHELAHGITEHEAGLIYFRQSGALNESLSDVFGSMVKQYHLGQTAEQADWFIGADLLADGIHGMGLRSMSHPGTAYDDELLGIDPQPSHMSEYVNTREDNGGVHLNSGIPNRAFYLTAIALGGHSWEKAGRIWYDTLCDKSLPQNADFEIFARHTIQHAAKRFNNTVADIVMQSWETVGVEVRQEFL